MTTWIKWLIISLIITLGSIGQIYLTYDNGIHTLSPIYVKEIRALDPLCIDPANSKFYPLDFCNNTDNSVLSLGLSALYSHNPNLPTKTLLMKIDLSQIPKSNIFQNITISSANLKLVSSHLPKINDNTSQADFSIYFGLCQNSTWMISTPDQELPCQNELEYAHPFPFSTFTPSFSSDISENHLDLTQQVVFARNSHLDTFTELVRFNPTKLIEPAGVDSKILNCLIPLSPYNSTFVFNKCIYSYKINVYGSEYGDIGDRPALFIEYTKESPFTMQLGILLAVTIGSLIVNRWITK